MSIVMLALFLGSVIAIFNRASERATRADRELVRSIVRTRPRPLRRRTVRRDPFATRPAPRGERAA